MRVSKMPSARWLLALLLLPPVAQAANDWPQARYDETHQGSVPSSLNADFKPFTAAWWGNGTAIAGPAGSPAVRDNAVYWGDAGGVLHAFDQESGGLLWSNTTGSRITSTPAVSGDFVYVLTEGGSVYSFNRKTGVAQSGYPLSVGASFGSILLHEDILYVGSSDGSLKAYFASQKTQKWSFGLSGTFYNTTCSGGSIVSTPVIFENWVMVGSTNKCFVAVDKTSFGSVSQPVWVFKATDSIRSTPAVDRTNRRVLFGDVSGKVYAISLSSTQAVSSPAWSYQEPLVEGLSSEIKAAPTIAGDKVIVAALNGNVRALSLSAGTSVWNRNLNGQVESSPAVANGYALVGSFDRKMYVLNVADGSIADSRLALAEIDTSPAISGSQGFWADKAGNLYSYGGAKPDRADLAVDGFSAGTLYAGQSASLSVTVKNVGVLASPATTGVFFAGGVPVGSFNVDALQPGQATSSTGSFTPANQGPITLEVFVDASRTVQESDEANNRRTITATVGSPATSTSGTNGGDGTEEEEGIPGFEVLLLAAAVVVVATRRRRS